MEPMEPIARNFTLDTFTKASEKMIATNDNAYRGRFDRMRRSQLKEYSKEEIQAIIERGTLGEQQKLSRNYFYKDGFYRQIIIHYATLLKYSGILIPNPGLGKQLSASHIQKKYHGALDYIDRLDFKTFLTNCALKALTDGCYYGVITQSDKTTFSYLDLPAGYCASNYKDEYGNDLIEFDVTYFTKITNTFEREAALAAYPKFITDYWKRYINGKEQVKWVVIPSDIGICFPMFDGRPLFLNVIPATIEYDSAVETEQERNREDIRKIIVQKIPHTTDGRLLFEPDEAAEIHRGTVQMMKGNKNLSVLTSYADVEAITSKTGADTVNNTLDRMLQNVYSNAGVSAEVFSSTGSTTLEQSLNNDLAMMMTLANKFSRFITNQINSLFGNTNITFRYNILPIGYFNQSKYAEDTFKLANSGYSFLLPAIAMDLSQRDIINIKDLENDVLGLGEKLRPLSSAYTQGDGATDEGGRPKKEADEKAEKTIENEKSLDNQTGGSK